MILYRTGDLLRNEGPLYGPCDALVNPVNCVGIQGAGLALQFKRAYPDYFQDYAATFARGDLKIGKIHVFSMLQGAAVSNPLRARPPFYILSFPTKLHWRDPSKLEYISAGLQDLLRVCDAHKINSVAIPALGCGLGSLSWDGVKPLLVQYLQPHPTLRAHVYAPREST